MRHLSQDLGKLVEKWRNVDNFYCEKYPAISEVLEFLFDDTGNSRYLRSAQIRALETYWYLRLMEETPHIFNLYKKIYKKNSDLLNALDLKNEIFNDILIDEGFDALLSRIKNDTVFVKEHSLESLHETLTLKYPSYIFALAMGAGKTVLIGAIIATEFAMAMEYPEGPFVKNSLVFAPGKTIIESLRELTVIPYEKILPPRMLKLFLSSVKLTFTRDGEKDIPIVRNSLYNIIVTNTEKIRIQKKDIRQTEIGNFLNPDKIEEAKSEVANLRLQKIASLQHLAVFSDEAHHTYGQSMDKELKKVRLTVDYLSENTNLLCVVNTTGTPYFKKKELEDVVFWYSLSEGIRDGILKDLSGNILSFNYDDISKYVDFVIKDFFEKYGDVKLPNGAQAKIAIYFPQTEDLLKLKPVIENALVQVGQSPMACIVNTSRSELTKQDDIEAFNRLNDPSSQHRIILLVNKGTEGWNCPSLFACALVRKLKNSNNFVLQASTRCLRQTIGNIHKACIYLSYDNHKILDKQLKETYGEKISDLNNVGQETFHKKIILRKKFVPPLTINYIRQNIIKRSLSSNPLYLKLPDVSEYTRLEKSSYTIAEQYTTSSILQQTEDTEIIETVGDNYDLYTAAVWLSDQYRLDIWGIYKELRRLYSENLIPKTHLVEIAKQIENTAISYEIINEEIEVALALVKQEGFTKEFDKLGNEIYTSEIAYSKHREHLLISFDDFKSINKSELSFHYSPYNFDSNPEKSFFEQVLNFLNIHPDEVEDMYFTGGLTDSSKTDFYVSYKDEDGKWRRYTPDFIIRKVPKENETPGSGKVIIVEIKAENERKHPINGENGLKAMAVSKWVDLNPDKLKYEMIFTSTDAVSYDQLETIRRFVQKQN